MVLPTKTLSIPKLEIPSFSLLPRLFAHCILAILCMLLQKNPKTGGKAWGEEEIEHMQFTGVLKKSMRKFQGSIKEEVKFLGEIN